MAFKLANFQSYKHIQFYNIKNTSYVIEKSLNINILNAIIAYRSQHRIKFYWLSEIATCEQSQRNNKARSLVIVKYLHRTSNRGSVAVARSPYRT